MNKLNVDGNHVAQKGYITDELGGYALDWLKKERDPKKPFFLYLSHKAVHSDPMPPPRYASIQLTRANFALPRAPPARPKTTRGQADVGLYISATPGTASIFYNSDMKMTEGYLRSYYDDAVRRRRRVGEILAYLRANKLEKDTMIAYSSSDNGFLIGDHGLIDKRNAYEGSVRVPMVALGARARPRRADQCGRIRNLDFAPTFLNLAGATARRSSKD